MDSGHPPDWTAELARTADLIVSTALRFLPARSAVLYRFDRETYRLVCVAAAGSARPSVWIGGSIAADVGIAGLAIREGRPVWSADVTQDPQVKLTGWILDRALEIGAWSAVAMPLTARADVQGVLCLGDVVGRRVSDNELALLRAFADHAAIAVENARLYQQAQAALGDLRAAQERLVQSATLRAVGELSAGAAHHLNNLLAVVLGRAQILLRKEDDSHRRRGLEMIEHAALDAADIVRRLQQFARATPGDALERVDLTEVLREVLEMTRVRWRDAGHGAGAPVAVDFLPSPTPPVLGDPVALREVAMNLVLNAIDAMPDGGAITVRTGTDGEMVVFSVADTGVGMSPEVLRRAREPFFTTKGVKSTGLGLSVSHGVIERHAGLILIESVEGRGTTITVRLPGLPPDQTAPMTVPAVTRARALRVLVVDDMPAVRELLGTLLAEQGHTVIQAGGGPEGLAVLDAGLPVDLVLTNLSMPGVNGWQVARAVKTRWPQVKVGLVTGWTDAARFSPLQPVAVDFVITKPFSPDSLAAAIGALAPL